MYAQLICNMRAENMSIYSYEAFDLRRYCSQNIISFENKWANFNALNTFSCSLLNYHFNICLCACIFGCTYANEPNIFSYIHRCFCGLWRLELRWHFVCVCVCVPLFREIMWCIGTNRNPYFKVIHRLNCTTRTEKNETEDKWRKVEVDANGKGQTCMVQKGRMRLE